MFFCRNSLPSIAVLQKLDSNNCASKKLRHKVNDYLLTKKIGTGSSSKVFLAEDTVTGHYYAIKVINVDNIGRSGPCVSQLCREIHLMNEYQHECIVKMHEVLYSSKKKKAYVVLELAECGSLRSAIDRNIQFTERQLASIFKQVAIGLKFLHSNSITHQDINPSNLLIFLDGVAKITDFGFVHSVQSSFNMAGTPAYQAPEVFDAFDEDNEGLVLDPEKEDVYALGVSLFESCFHHLPHEGDNIYEIAADIINNPLEIPDGISPELHDLLIKMLAIDPSERISINGIINHPFMQQINEVISLPIPPIKLPDIHYSPEQNYNEIIAEKCESENRFSNHFNYSNYVKTPHYTNMVQYNYI